MALIPPLKIRQINYGSEIANRPVPANGSGSGTTYQIEKPDGTVYFITGGAGNDPFYVKSTDRGKTWTWSSSLKAITITQIACWYDRWSGIDSDYVHILYTDSGTDDVFYRSLNLANDTLGTEHVVFAGASTAAGGCLSITRTRGGNLIACGMIDAGAELFARKCTNANTPPDAAGDWADIAVVMEATLDQIWLVPNPDSADNNDAICIYWDNSANELSRKIYDDSANSWAETTISSAVVMTMPSQTTFYPNVAVSHDIANTQIVVCAWSAADTAAAQLYCWVVKDGSITQKTSVVTSSTDDQCGAVVAIDVNTTNHWVVFYLGDTTGYSTYNTALDVYYKETTDGGTNWGSETRVEGGRIVVTWLFGTPRYYYLPCVVRGGSSTSDCWETTMPLNSPDTEGSIGI